MAQYIAKDAIMAEIERRIDKENEIAASYSSDSEHDYLCRVKEAVYKDFLSFINTFEVKEGDEKYKRPTIEVTDDVSVASRMTYIDDELKPIAEFILNYASWNLHKDEWNQPVLEVPVFRVLDALAQRGKPYCEG